IPVVAEERVARGEAFLLEVGVVVVAGYGEQALLGVERQARLQVNDAADTAFDHLGGRVLEDVDAGEQVGRDVLERETAAVVRRKDVAAVGFAADPRETTDENTAAFGGEAR